MSDPGIGAAQMGEVHMDKAAWSAEHRRAALALHAASAHDRAWVLQRLDVPTRTVLEGLIRELYELGIPATAGQPTGATAVNAAAPATEPPLPPTARDRVRNARADELHAALAHEPPDVVAALLAIETFAWRSECMALFTPQQRVQIDAAAARAPTSACADELLRAVARRLGTTPSPAPAVTASSPTPPWRATLSRWAAPLSRWSASWR